MIIINEDKAQPGGKIKKLIKGTIINDCLALEDVLDLSRKDSKNRHKGLFKCLKCGRVFISPIRYQERTKCYCQLTHPRRVFRTKKLKMLKFLNAERNRLNAEAFFEEDFERVKGFDEVIAFLKSNDLKHFFNEDG